MTVVPGAAASPAPRLSAHSTARESANSPSVMYRKFTSGRPAAAHTPVTSLARNSTAPRVIPAARVACAARAAVRRENSPAR